MVFSGCVMSVICFILTMVLIPFCRMRTTSGPTLIAQYGPNPRGRSFEQPSAANRSSAVVVSGGLLTKT